MSAAELTALAADRHPWDWYVDESWCTELLLRTLGFDAFHGQLIHDPCCGRGTIPQLFDLFGFSVCGADVEDRRGAWGFALGDWPFWTTNFLTADFAPFNTASSIVMNPPYSLQDGRVWPDLTARFVAKALRVASHKVAALVPLKWLASDQRYKLFAAQVPAHVIILNERPSMPPGHLIGEMGERAFGDGKADYCWVVWDKQIAVKRGDTRTWFTEPRAADIKRGRRGQ
jgi:hypothetical protein